MKKTNVKEFADKLQDAYTTNAYGGNWGPCIKMLLRRGYNEREIEAIIRSKWTRWAADGSANRYGHNTSSDLARFLDSQKNLPAEVAELVAGTFEFGRRP